MSERSQNWRSAALAGLAFGPLFALAFGFFEGWLPPRSGADVVTLITTALVTGAAFAIAIGLFGGSKMVAHQTAIELPAGEVVQLESPANHFLHVEARGGRLYLTNRHLIFQPHKFNLQAAAISIPREDIAGVAKVMTLGVIPNGLRVMRRDGTAERFVLSNRNAWVRAISPGGTAS
jgi:GRAM domain-containing protein